MSWSLRKAQETAARKASQPTLEAMLYALQTAADKAVSHAGSPTGQQALEQVFLLTLQAFDRYQLQAERVMDRLQQKETPVGPQGSLRLFEDRAELWQDNELCGSWPLYSPDDRHHAYALAREMGYELHQHASNQLALF